MADYWIKWYHEIIDDPKMATLPDRLWRRFSELCLLAGKLGGNEKSGTLPDTRQLAWMLRMSTDDLQLDLIQLSRTDLIEAIPNGWVIPKFNVRQSAVGVTERVRQHRDRKQKQQYNGDVTIEKRFVTQNTETEEETETEHKTTSSGLDTDFAELSASYEQNIGPLTGVIAEIIGDDLNEYGLFICKEAITIAAKQNVRKWSYVQGILKRIKRDGHGTQVNGKQEQLDPDSIELIFSYYGGA